MSIPSGKRRGEVGLLLVVEGVVEAEARLEEPDLLRAPRAADDAAPGELRELADQLAHRAGGRGHEHRLALLRRADLVEPDVRREPRQAEDARVVGQRHAVVAAVVGDLGEQLGHGRLDDAVVLPAGDAPDEVAWVEVRAGGVHHPRHAVAGDDGARDERGRVRLPHRPRHLGPHVRVARQVERFFTSNDPAGPSSLRRRGVSTPGSSSMCSTRGYPSTYSLRITRRFVAISLCSAVDGEIESAAVFKADRGPCLSPVRWSMWMWYLQNAAMISIKFSVWCEQCTCSGFFLEEF
jgi:hypothetical protein